MPSSGSRNSCWQPETRVLYGLIAFNLEGRDFEFDHHLVESGGRLVLNQAHIFS